MQHTSRRGFLCGCLTCGLADSLAGAQSFTPPRSHAELANGNSRFASGHARHPHSSLKWLRRTVREGQHPHAVVLCCSDSRVSPEILFDQGIGDLFVVRVAGNVLREDEVASIEYAVEHLHVSLCVVLGHSGCGAVRSVVTREHLLAEVEHLTEPIREAMQSIPSTSAKALSQTALVEAVVREHVVRTRDRIRTASAFLDSECSSGHLRTEGAVFDLNSGRVAWL